MKTTKTTKALKTAAANDAQWAAYRAATHPATRYEQAFEQYRAQRALRSSEENMAPVVARIVRCYGVPPKMLARKIEKFESVPATIPTKPVACPKAKKPAKKYSGDGKMAIAVTVDGILIVGARKIDRAIARGKVIAAQERAYVRAIQCARWAFKVRKNSAWVIGRQCDMPEGGCADARRFVYGSAK
jgi:hypothetical protein